MQWRCDCAAPVSGGSIGHLNFPIVTQYQSPNLIRGFSRGSVSLTDDPAWAGFGSRSVDEYAFWAPRACGPACLAMVLDHLGRKYRSLQRIVDDCLECGAFEVSGESVRGLIYAPFASYVQSVFGLQTKVYSSLDLNDVQDAVGAGQLAIVSVGKDIRDVESSQHTRGGHLVLVFGMLKGDVCFRNPSGYGSDTICARLPREVFEQSFAHRGVILGAK